MLSQHPTTPKPMMLILPCQSRAAELQLFISKNWRGGEPSKPKSRSKSRQANCKARVLARLCSRLSSLRPCRTARISYVISLYHGIEAASHRISGTPYKLVPPLSSKLPKQQCSPVIGILLLTLPPPPIEGFLYYRGVSTKLLRMRNEYKEVGMWCWTRRAFVS
jgi:hypothetical protein